MASHIRKKSATPCTQKKSRNIEVSLHQKSQEEEIDQKTNRGEKTTGARVEKEEEREIDLEIVLEIEINSPGKRLGEL